MKIAFVDQDGHKVKLTKKQVARCLYFMGVDEGRYLLVPNYQEMPGLGTNVVLAIRTNFFPKYSKLQMWQKRRKHSKLLNQQVPVNIKGVEGTVTVEKRPVWLSLKHNETHVIEV